MNIAIVDDEAYYREKIKELIVNEDRNIDTYSSGIELLQTKKHYDLLLLDIDMPELSGLKLKDYFKETKIIYITQYEDYMYEAFDVQVIGYILKSDLNKLNDLLTKYAYLFEEKTIQVLYQDIQISSIISITKEKNLTYIHTTKQTIECTITLKSLMERINDNHFIYIRRSIIINKHHLVNYDTNKVIMDNKQVYSIARNYKKKVQETIYD